MKIYHIEYWQQENDSYDLLYTDVPADNLTAAIEIARMENPRGRKFEEYLR